MKQNNAKIKEYAKRKLLIRFYSMEAIGSDKICFIGVLDRGLNWG